MKTVLAISDSVEGTPYDLKRTTKTIKGFNMDPLLVVPAIFERDGTHVVNESEEILDYVFSPDCEISAVSIGYMTEQSVVENLAQKLRTLGKGRVPIIYQPSLFTDDGEILVNEDLFYSICDNLIPNVDLIIINRFEAELLYEEECHTEGDFTNAARDISKQFKCAVLIRHVEGVGGKNLLFNGVSSLWINTPPHLIDGANRNFNLMSAVACSMVEKPLIGSAIRNGIYFCSIDKNKPAELYEVDDEDEFVAPEVTAEVVPEVVTEEVPFQEVLEEVVVEPVEEHVIEAPVLEEPIVEEKVVEEPAPVAETPAPVARKPFNAADYKTALPKLDMSTFSFSKPIIDAPAPKVEEKPEVKVEEQKEEPAQPKISAADAIRAAKMQSGLLSAGNVPERKPKVRAPLTSTPVPSLGFGSVLNNKDDQSDTTSLVSPVKTLRDIARTLDSTIRDGEEPTAVTSAIEKPEPGPKAPVMDITPDSSVVKLQALRERLNNMTGSDKN
ncbi:MAG: hydroxymethylpyrimidine/phosphomethylpyrimidine kinase [Saccharofermentans sp.]|nr:hydroxymethylpyrimidine/phosphomethylpyrimidine kinase [Saccharofermentans sp.]